MQVVSARGRQHSNTARAASAVAAAVMAALALFEAGLVAGLPWGAAAWGGGQAVLSPGMRLASAGAALWVFAAYAALMVVANAASASGTERALMTPISVVLAVTCALTARWGAALGASSPHRR